MTLAVFLHILAAAIWAGGLIFVGLTAGAARRTIPERERVEFFRVLGTGFLILAGIAATLLLISGNILIEDLFGGWGKLGESSSGELVLWKTALFVAVLFLAPSMRSSWGRGSGVLPAPLPSAATKPPEPTR